MSLRMFRKLDFLRNLKDLLGAYLMRVRLIPVFKLVYYWEFFLNLVIPIIKDLMFS